MHTYTQEVDGLSDPGSYKTNGDEFMILVENAANNLRGTKLSFAVSIGDGPKSEVSKLMIGKKMYRVDLQNKVTHSQPNGNFQIQAGKYSYAKVILDVDVLITAGQFCAAFQMSLESRGSSAVHIIA